MNDNRTAAPRPLARRILWITFGLTAALLAVHLLFQYLNLEVYDEKQGQIFELSNRLDMDDEVGLPTWVSQLSLLAVAATAWLAARLDSGSRRRAWTLVAVLGLLMSMDEVAAIHEFVLQTAFLLYYGDTISSAVVSGWWLALPVIIAAAGWLIWWLSRTLPARTIKLFIVAGGLYLTGAAGLELISNDADKTTYLYQGIMTGLEETLELLGSSLALYTILDYLERHRAEGFNRLRRLLAGGR